MRPAELTARLYTAQGLLAAVCLVSMLGLRWSLEKRDMALQEVRAASEYSRAVQRAGVSCRRYLESVVAGGLGRLTDGRAARTELQRTRTAAGHLGMQDDAHELERLSRFISASEALSARIERLRAAGKSNEAATLYRTGVLPLAEEFASRTLEGRLSLQEQRQKNAVETLEGWTRLTVGLAAGLMAVAFLLFGLWTRSFAHYLTTHLEHIRRTVQAVGSGNYDVSLPAGKDDEVGRLTASVNEMASRLRSAQARMVEVERLAALGQLANGAAHAINNPLAAVIGFSDLLLLREDLPDAARADLMTIRDQAKRCDAILRNLRQFAGGETLEKTPVAVNDLLQRLVEFMKPSLEGAGIAVDLRLEAGLPPVSASAHELQQVFYNLIMNACQALRGRPEPRVVLTTWTDGGTVAVAVDDNGEGIAREHLPRLFEPFFTTRPPGEALGLGLSSAHGIVSSAGGEIRVRSDRGAGSRFEVRLPALPASGRRPPRPEPASGRALIIDDEPEILNVVGRVLRRAGLSVEVTGDSEDALRLCRTHDYDVILSDYRMAGLDGIQLCEAVRKTRPEAADRFIFSTGEIVSKEFQSYADRHGLPVLVKPFDLDELVAVVKGRLRKARESVS